MRYGLALDALIVGAALCTGVASDVQANPAFPKPYLSQTAEPDEGLVLPPPPVDGTPTAEGEHDLFTSTRALDGTPRWRLAQADAERAPAAVWADFGCALGSTIAPDRVPTAIALIGRLNSDVEQATSAVKNQYQRKRPLVGNTAPLCVARTDKLAQSYSFPSGHATQGWATALVLAELSPDRAALLLQRGRVFGESRIVCGVHWASDVEAGRTAAAALVAALHGNADFRHDLDAARAELAAARASSAGTPDAALCHGEAEAAAHPFAE